MSRTVLGSLHSYENVNGEGSLGRRVPRERTHVERHTITMYERREETWRRLNRDRVAAFIELYLLAMVRVENENGLSLGFTTTVSGPRTRANGPSVWSTSENWTWI